MALEELTAPSGSEFLSEEANEQIVSDQLSEQSKGLDLSGAVDDPLDLFNGLNLNAIEEDDKLINTLQSSDNPDQVVNTDQNAGPGDPKPGDPPEKTLADAKKIFKKGLIRDKVLSANLGSVGGASRNVYEAAKAYRFDRFKSNVERYEAYGKETFNELGFNPLMDNEEYYNKNTSNWQDWKRMFGQFGNLFGVAFNSNYRSFSSSVNEGTVLDLDEEGNDVFSEANRIGSSTKGGFTGFGVNLALNSAYMIGMTANVVFEEAIIWGVGTLLAPVTGGASLAGSAAVQTAEAVSIASRIGKIRKAITGAFSTTRAGKVFTTTTDLLKGLSRAEDSKSFYQFAKGFAGRTLTKINPFMQTTQTLRDIYKGDAAFRNLSNVAKMSRTFGSFYRDMRENWFTISESQLEGAGVMQERLDENIRKFQKENDGALPTGKDLDNAYANAYAAGRVDALGNIPLIYLTNRITFNGIFKFKGIGNLIEGFEKSTRKGLSKKLMYDAGSKTIIRKAEQGFWKGTLNSVKSLPKTLVSGGLWYTKANLAEGIQELGQEWLAGTTKEYYKKMYTDPAVNQSKLLKSSIYGSLVDAVGSQESWESVKQNIFSKQGLSTFASGFLMGGLVGGSRFSLTKLSNALYTKMGEAYMSYNNPAAFEAYKKDKTALEEKHVSILNNLLSDPENFFNKRYQSFYNQRSHFSNMTQSDKNKNDKDFHDSKDMLTFDHVHDLLESDTFDLILDGYKELSKLSDKELADYFNVEDGTKAREKLNDYQDRAEQIKERYNYINENFANPFNPKNFQKGSEDQKNEFIAYKGYEEAKKAAIFSQHGFDRSLQRMAGIYDDLMKEPPLKKISQTELSVLLNPDTIGSEIKLLRQEAELLAQSADSEDKKLAKAKLKRAGILEQYSAEFQKASEEKDYSKLSKIYKAYLRVLADEKKDYLFDSNVDDSFSKILDHYQLNDDAKMYMANVNYLTNPNNLVRHAERISAVLNEIYANKENIAREGIKNFFSVVELSSFLESLGNINIVVDPEELIQLYAKGTIPSTFFDVKTGREISKNDPRVITIQGMLDLFTKIKKGTEKVSEVPKEEKKEQKKEEKKEKKKEEQKEEKKEEEEEKVVSKDLQSKLEDAYNTFMDETGSNMSFDDFVATHPTAARIKAENAPKPEEKVIEVKLPEIEVVEETKPTTLVSDVESKIKKLFEFTERGQITLAGEDYDLIKAVRSNPTDENIKEFLELYKSEIGKYEQAVVDEVNAELDALEGKPTEQATEVKPAVESSNALKLEEDKNTMVITLKNYNVIVSKVSALVEPNAVTYTFTIAPETKMEDVKNLIGDIQLSLQNLATTVEVVAPVTDTTFTIKLSEEAVQKQPTQRQQIAQEKINNVLNKITSLRNAPSSNLNDTSKASKELLNLIKNGEVTSDEVEAAVKQKYEELLSKLQLSDFIKGDVVIFKNGRKGIVNEVSKDGLKMKMFDGPGVIEKMDASKVINNVVSIKNTKEAIEDEQKEPIVEVSKEDEDNMKKSQEGTENLATDSKRASDAINKGIDNASNQPPGFDDLFLGCD